jgi:hypothetical protein
VEGRQPAVGVLGGDHGVKQIVLILVATLGLTSCTSDDDKPSAEPSGTTVATPSPTPRAAPPPPPAPTAGACYRLSYDEAVAPTNEDTPVPCKKPHTSQTFAVGQLDLVTNGHLLAVDSDAVRAQVAHRCPGQLAAYVGATEEQLRLSLLRPVWFTPTIEQSDAGAAWYRCDVIAVTGDKQVARIDHDLAGALKEPGSRSELALCGTAQPGTAAFSRVLCREDHSWKAISVIDLAGESKDGSYPGADAVNTAGGSACADAARAIASDALDYEWGYEWPTKDQWQAGQTYGRCWSPDPP